MSIHHKHHNFSYLLYGAVRTLSSVAATQTNITLAQRRALQAAKDKLPGLWDKVELATARGDEKAIEKATDAYISGVEKIDPAKAHYLRSVQIATAKGDHIELYELGALNGDALENAKSEHPELAEYISDKEREADECEADPADVKEALAFANRKNKPGAVLTVLKLFGGIIMFIMVWIILAPHTEDLPNSTQANPSSAPASDVASKHASSGRNSKHVARSVRTKHHSI